MDFLTFIEQTSKIQIEFKKSDLASSREFNLDWTGRIFFHFAPVRSLNIKKI